MTPGPMQTRGSVLAFDFGLKRIGVAIGDWENCLAHPLETISGEGHEVRFGRIAALIDEWRPTQLVCGLPVALVDERLTSFDADLRLREAGVKGSARKGLDDAVAAQQILQDYFDHAHATASATALA